MISRLHIGFACLGISVRSAEQGALQISESGMESVSIACCLSLYNLVSSQHLACARYWYLNVAEPTMDETGPDSDSRGINDQVSLLALS